MATFARAEVFVFKLSSSLIFDEVVFRVGKLNDKSIGRGEYLCASPIDGSFTPIEIIAGGELVFEEVHFRISDLDTPNLFALWESYRKEPVTFGFSYKDHAGLTRDVNVSCTNFPPRPA